MSRAHKLLVSALAALQLSGCGRAAPLPASQHEPQSRAQILEQAKKIGPQDCTKDLKYEVANGYLGGAEEQIAKGDYRRANILLRDGVETLGDIFLGDDVIDDTGLRLSLAHSQEWDGQYKPAANIRRRTLAERLASYAELHNLKGCRSPPQSWQAAGTMPAPSSE